MNLIDELYLWYDGSILSSTYKLLKIGKLLGIETKTCNEIPNKCWNMANKEMEGRKLMKAKQIFKSFSEK